VNIEPSAVRAHDIDLSSTDFWLQPANVRDHAFALLRRELPVARYATPNMEGSTIVLPPGDCYYSLTRHADVAEASRHPEVFLSGPGAVTLIDLPPEVGEYFSGMISTDDPRHARLRRIVSNAFSPRNVRVIEESIERVAREVVSRALDSGSGDFVADIAAPFPLKIICAMMGVPESEHATVLRCANVILSMGDPDFIPVGIDPTLAFLEAGSTLSAIMDDLAAWRTQHPVDDITSALLNATVESERLSRPELASFFVLLVTAGSETVRTALSHSLIAYDEHPDQRRLVSHDYETLHKSATDEIVRWSTPISWMRRTLASDYTIRGVDLHKGDKVVLFYCSANRDEDIFEDPFTFSVSRTPNEHFGYGAPGPHFCLGAHLARREISVMWRELFAHAPNVHHIAPPDRLASSFVNGIKRLRYEF
jgi:cytochrome P450